MAEKKYLHNIKLVGSVINDENGNQISLTKDERLGIVNAVGGPLTATNPVVSKSQHENDINALRAGLKWRDPVDTVTDTAPVTPIAGDRYLNTTDNKIYTCATPDDWGVGETPVANWTVFAKDSDEEWTYDAEEDKWVMKSAGSIPYATESTPGKVRFAPNGGTNSGEAVQGNDRRLLKGHYSNTLTNPTGTITLNHALGSDKIIVQAWSGGEEAEIAVAKNTSDPTNKIDISVNGTPATLEVNVIALP
jgi:hypothetical protein